MILDWLYLVLPVLNIEDFTHVFFNAIDGWGNPIIVSIDNSTISLKSYGEDGKPGGIEQDEDMEHRFSIRRTEKSKGVKPRG